MKSHGSTWKPNNKSSMTWSFHIPASLTLTSSDFSGCATASAGVASASSSRPWVTSNLATVAPWPRKVLASLGEAVVKGGEGGPLKRRPPLKTTGFLVEKMAWNGKTRIFGLYFLGKIGVEVDFLVFLWRFVAGTALPRSLRQASSQGANTAGRRTRDTSRKEIASTSKVVMTRR